MFLKKKKIKGSALIEFAFVLPVLLLIVIGIVEFGILFYDKAVITNASREGARYGTLYRTPTYASATEVSNYVKTYTDNNLLTFGSPTTPVTVTVVSSTNPPTFGDTLTVTVTYPYTYLVLYNFLGISNQITLTANTVMTYE